MNWNDVGLYLFWPLGAVTTMTLIFRILAVLEQEFADEDGVVKNPLKAAADKADSYAKFRKNEWQAYQALWAAMRFRSFFKFFQPLLEPKLGKLFGLLLIVVYVVLILAAYAQPWPKEAQALVPALATFLNTSWLAIIERGKLLKKSVTQLQIT